MFQIAPGQRGSWSGLAVAHHLAGDLDMAFVFLNRYLDITEVREISRADEIIFTPHLG